MNIWWSFPLPTINDYFLQDFGSREAQKTVADILYFLAPLVKFKDRLTSQQGADHTHTRAHKHTHTDTQTHIEAIVEMLTWHNVPV